MLPRLLQWAMLLAVATIAPARRSYEIVSVADLFCVSNAFFRISFFQDNLIATPQLYQVRRAPKFAAFDRGDFPS